MMHLYGSTKHMRWLTFVGPAKTDIPLSFKVTSTVGCLFPEVKSEALINLRLSAASSFASLIVKDPKN